MLSVCDRSFPVNADDVIQEQLDAVHCVFLRISHVFSRSSSWGRRLLKVNLCVLGSPIKPVFREHVITRAAGLITGGEAEGPGPLRHVPVPLQVQRVDLD